MRILAVDSSSNVASAAIMDDNILIGECSINYKKTHSQTLMPMIETLMHAVEADIESVDLFAVSNGPGSFTGLRIGLATIKGLAHACQKPITLVSTLEALAYNLPYNDGLIVPILDARRDHVYTAIYTWKNEMLKTHTEPCAVSIASLLNILKSNDRRIIFLGDGIVRFETQIKEVLGSRALFAPGNVSLQRASSVAAAAFVKQQSSETVKYDDVIPVYLRKSQAEREYEEKHKEGQK